MLLAGLGWCGYNILDPGGLLSCDDAKPRKLKVLDIGVVLGKLNVRRKGGVIVPSCELERLNGLGHILRVPFRCTVDTDGAVDRLVLAVGAEEIKPLKVKLCGFLLWWNGHVPRLTVKDEPMVIDYASNDAHGVVFGLCPLFGSTKVHELLLVCALVVERVNLDPIEVVVFVGIRTVNRGFDGFSVLAANWGAARFSKRTNELDQERLTRGCEGSCAGRQLPC